MRRFAMVLIVLIAAPVLARADAPTTRLADMLPLVDGSIRYLPPDRWKEIGKPDKLHAYYATEDGHGRISVAITVEDRDMPDSAAGRMAMIIGKAIRENAKKENRELLYGPRVEKDPRFFLVVHDRMTTQDGSEVADRMQLYRVMGLNLVNLAVTAVVPRDSKPEAAQKILSAGQEMLAGMQLTRGAAPVVFPRTRVRLTTPVDWKFSKLDQPNGPTVTYSDSKNPIRKIYVRSRILPKDARTDAAKRDIILNRMIEQGWEQPPLHRKPADGKQAGSGKGAYLRQIRTTVIQGEQKMQVETRYMVVGDVILSIRAVAPEEDQQIGTIADDLAKSANPITG
jgi:hypothetical protein